MQERKSAAREHMSSLRQLLQERRFAPFFATQFLGAFNDNVFKTALITLVVFHGDLFGGVDGQTLATVLPGLFILPFFLFSATSGQWCDKYDKAWLARGVKLAEVAIMLLAAWGFAGRQLWLLVLALFLMGLHSTVFGPLKYAYLPQHLRRDELLAGNGLVEMATFVAILLGQVLGAALVMQGSDSLWLAASVVIGLALLGYVASRGMPASPPPAPELRVDYRLLRASWHNLRLARADATVWWAILAISWFWFYGATLLAQLPTHVRQVLHGDESVFILLLTLFSLGVGTGSMLCERLSRGRSALRLVLPAGLGLTLFGGVLHMAASLMPPSAVLQSFTVWATQPAALGVMLAIVLLGVSGGLYIVPLYALIQTHGAASQQARLFACTNIMNACYMVASAAIALALFALGLDIPGLLLAVAVANLLWLGLLAWQRPEYRRTA